MENSNNLPRYASLNQDNNLLVDQAKIKVSQEIFSNDKNLLNNILLGKVLSSSIYPLIYNKKTSSNEVSYRSLEFYRELVQDPKLYNTIPKEYLPYFLSGLRDLYFAANFSLLSDEEAELLKKVIFLVPEEANDNCYFVLHNVNVTPYPTSTNIQVKFFSQEQLKPEHYKNEYYIKNELNFLIGFVNPQSLSFHNFENIVSLDFLFDKLNPKYSIENFQKLKDADIYTFQLKEETSTNILKELDKFDLYTIPINSSSRGGKRFIFDSSNLGDALTETIKNSKDIQSIPKIADNFELVNYIFRYNKFAANDKKFLNHYDTPFFDRIFHHYSKYTLILYLTNGTANPVLRFNQGKGIDNKDTNDDITIEKIENSTGVTAVLFDQKYEHEGKAFIDSEKIFLRTELIHKFKDNDFDYDDEATKIFNVACYMTKQSLFNKELNAYSSDCFNQSSLLRLNLAKQFDLKYLLKTYEGINFITDGNDFWFLKDLSLKEAAIITVLDYFNAFQKGLDYNNILQKCEIVTDNINKSENISNQFFQMLEENAKKQSEESLIKKGSKKIKKIDNDSEKCFLEQHTIDWKLPFNYPKPKTNMCCKKHNSSNFNPENCDGVINKYKELVTKLLNDINSHYTVSIFNEEVKFDFSKIVVTENKILFNTLIPRIHYAGCGYEDQCDLTAQNWVKGSKHCLTGFYNLPPITYNISEKGYMLRLDLFNNNFIRRKVEKTITIPSIYTYPGSTSEENKIVDLVFTDPADQWINKEIKTKTQFTAMRGNLKDRTTRGRGRGRGV